MRQPQPTGRLLHDEPGGTPLIGGHQDRFLSRIGLVKKLPSVKPPVQREVYGWRIRSEEFVLGLRLDPHEVHQSRLCGPDELRAEMPNRV